MRAMKARVVGGVSAWDLMFVKALGYRIDGPDRNGMAAAGQHVAAKGGSCHRKFSEARMAAAATDAARVGLRKAGEMQGMDGMTILRYMREHGIARLHSGCPATYSCETKTRALKLAETCGSVKEAAAKCGMNYNTLKEMVAGRKRALK